MLLRTLFRSSAATYVIPLLVVFVLLAIGHDLTSWTTDHYWPSATGSSTYALPFVSTICAGLGAWEGARLSRGGVFGHPHVRSPLGVSAPVLTLVVAGGAITCLVALCLSANAAAVGWGSPDWGILAVELLVVTSNTLVGYCIGRRWTAVLSVPAVLVSAFVANAYPASWNILWIRHLVGGGLSACCGTDQVLNVWAVWSAVAFTLGIVLACVTVISFDATRKALVSGLLLVLVGTGVGTAFAHGLSSEPLVARPDSDLRCESVAGLKVCLWPEVRDPAMVRSQASRVVRSLHEAGVSTPDVLTMAAHASGKEAKLGISPGARQQDISAGVVSGLLPPTPACAARQSYPAAEAAAPVAAWMLLTAGATVETTTRHTGTEATALAQKIRSLPSETQTIWYRVNFQAMGACDVNPQLIPRRGGS
ncbi:hypothetical protein PZB75_07815 [Streptomyces sp. AM 4-1-1]|uniref:DUF7224 domain-containing protein n=1 Tax=Streptomyces sp. AM 4-1-1 TaxID=3028710 RepID=UPI0023B8E7B8|nr:hypothetical protein [Streptomyces sp. AM 4-1-1]WEH33293.1 hypothetical protein PZB75_07815 [Streptomyces sp. AM 4-1-1]